MLSLDQYEKCKQKTYDQRDYRTFNKFNFNVLYDTFLILKYIAHRVNYDAICLFYYRAIYNCWLPNINLNKIIKYNFKKLRNIHKISLI